MPPLLPLQLPRPLPLPLQPPEQWQPAEGRRPKEAGQEELLLAKVQAKYLGGDDIRSQIVAIYTEHCPRKLSGTKF